MVGGPSSGLYVDGLLCLLLSTCASGASVVQQLSQSPGTWKVPGLKLGRNRGLCDH